MTKSYFPSFLTCLLHLNMNTEDNGSTDMGVLLRLGKHYIMIRRFLVQLLFLYINCFLNGFFLILSCSDNRFKLCSDLAFFVQLLINSSTVLWINFLSAPILLFGWHDNNNELWYTFHANECSTLRGVFLIHNSKLRNPVGTVARSHLTLGFLLIYYFARHETLLR